MYTGLHQVQGLPAGQREHQFNHSKHLYNKTTLYFNTISTTITPYFNTFGLVMKRLLEQALIEWKDSQQRSPLILRGARQVGKTYLH